MIVGAHNVVPEVDSVQLKQKSALSHLWVHQPRRLKEPRTIVVNRKVKVVSTSGTKAPSLRT
ncbi:hypothetical protein PCAR4_900046 [Paraburkholderia caribensis]|nr:hypothetical protein PCAR4_900046 [Paraburkholderia caribensis]